MFSKTVLSVMYFYFFLFVLLLCIHLVFTDKTALHTFFYFIYFLVLAVCNLLLPQQIFSMILEPLACIHKPVLYICYFTSLCFAFICMSFCMFLFFFNFYLLTLVKMFQIGLVDHMLSMVFHQSCVMQ